jgi:hypothetical protein
LSQTPHACWSGTAAHGLCTKVRGLWMRDMFPMLTLDQSTPEMCENVSLIKAVRGIAGPWRVISRECSNP